MKPLRFKFKRLHPDAVIPFKTYDNDYCYDCIATSCEEIAPDVYKYGLGFALQVNWKDRDLKIPMDKLLSIDIRPRSSVWRHGLVLSNSVGTIDEGYTGEISVVFYHVNKNLEPYNVGDKICQMKLGFTIPIEFEETAELDKTERNSNGYGSTGK